MRWIRMLLPDETDFENIGRMIGEGGCVGCLGCFSLLVHLAWMLPVLMICLLLLAALAYVVFDSLKFW